MDVLRSEHRTFALALATAIVGLLVFAGAGVAATPMLAAGTNHTCSLSADGGVQCWGDNFNGQLGDATNNDTNIPVPVDGLASGVEAIAAGVDHTCALTDAGGVKCWGGNFRGQLGDASNDDSNVPVDVDGLSTGVEAVAARGDFTCAVTTTGGAKCWGYNGYGQLGDGTTTHRNSPVDVGGPLTDVVGISAGHTHACAVISGGGVKCWGENLYGWLGDGTDTNSIVPVDVINLSSPVLKIAVGQFHSCALNTVGGVQCWGGNQYDQLGDGSGSQSEVPVDVSGLTSGVASLSVGNYHSCAVTTAAAVKCWGSNDDGELGDDSGDAFSNTPVDVVGLASGVASTASGGSHTCALTTSGNVKCWGYNFNGELGDGTNDDSSVPVDVSGLALFEPTSMRITSPSSAISTDLATASITFTTLGSGAINCEYNGAPAASPLIVSLSPGINQISIVCVGEFGTATDSVTITYLAPAPAQPTAKLNARIATPKWKVRRGGNKLRLSAKVRVLAPGINAQTCNGTIRTSVRPTRISGRSPASEGRPGKPKRARIKYFGGRCVADVSLSVPAKYGRRGVKLSLINWLVGSKTLRAAPRLSRPKV